GMRDVGVTVRFSRHASEIVALAERNYYDENPCQMTARNLAIRELHLKNPRRKAKRRAAETEVNGRAKSPPHQRTLRDFYGEAAGPRAGIKPNERSFEENPAGMAPGEMLLWSLGGSVCDQELAVSLDNVATDIQAFITSPETRGIPSLPSDVCD